MNHLGERLTALVDGELDHDERDRALAHLASCQQCRTEAETLRRLKGRLRSFGTADEAAPSADLMSRLTGMAAMDVPAPQPVRSPRRTRRPVPAGAVRRPPDQRPARRPARAAARRRAYVAVGAAAVVFSTASYVAGADTEPMPAVVPAFDRFSVEHGQTSGDVPLPVEPALGP
ncbi:anti-sigma factor [Actinomadura craniellae]|uniref:Anti-sigma factor n=1 Tax=Actinomadura craniellae TaxID=2231787 RepID=A0A365H617_9ACTN|nr:zf-HC2 domain-containing protein [Actinomadura craniellae]RAY14489.1 anti-sigma factor [Actinomadura craniellae]